MAFTRENEENEIEEEGWHVRDDYNLDIGFALCVCVQHIEAFLVAVGLVVGCGKQWLISR